MRSVLSRSGNDNRVRAAASHNAGKSAAQRRTHEPVADNSAQAERAAQLRSVIDNSARAVAQRQQVERFAGGVAQRAAPEDELQMKSPDDELQMKAPEDELQMKSPEDELQMKAEGPLQAVGEEDELLQGKFPASRSPAQLKDIPEGPANETGLPDNLKAGVESLSGLSMDDVRVHRNSAKPAGLRALAYTQGSDIHVAPGQDQHLAHEAWHVVQQKEGRVKPDMQMKDVDVNADPVLEHEADVMGAKAASVEKDARR